MHDRYLNADDLSLGDELVVLSYDSWSNHVGIASGFRVTKILNTRVVIVTSNGTEQRWIIDKHDRSLRKLEGAPEYRSPTLTTQDSERHREAVKRNTRDRAFGQARSLAKKFSDKREAPIEDIDELIAALTAVREIEASK